MDKPTALLQSTIGTHSAATIEDRALRWHQHYRGKVQVLPKCAVRSLDDLAVWYSPGVAATCRAIAADPAVVFEHTNKANSIAIVSNGTRVLGLGNIGPEAGLPVMEGKALLFKYLGGVDAVPICLATEDQDEIVRTVRLLHPSFGGINLEDIAQPGCFRILERLRADLAIPVWHDDQQGSAAVVLAALFNAIKVVGKELRGIRFAMIGMGAANVATYRLLKAAGVDPSAIVACDSKGVLHPGRTDIEESRTTFPEKWLVCRESNGDRRSGGIDAALRGTDVCIAFSQCGPGVIRPEWVRTMRPRAIVFACANPVPEVWPHEALEAGAAIVGTGRGDLPNQVNNSLCFPGIFRGVLDVRAHRISDDMAIAAATELAAAAEPGLAPDRILPRMDEWEVAARVAAATGIQAQAEGLARLSRSRAELFEAARSAIKAARDATQLLMREGLIAPPPV